jgi:phage FluMu gp28-like protein
MNQDVLNDFADQLGVDRDVIEDRWQGRPDRLAEDLFRVQDMDSGVVEDLQLFDTQRKAMHAYFYGDADTINNYKGRRIGYSFIYCVAFLLEGILVPNSVYPIVSRKFEQACNRITDIQKLIDNAAVDIPTQKDNRDEIILWNGSKYKAYSGDPDASRGDDSARAVLLDEMAFIEDQEKVSRAFGAFLALGNDRKMVQVSTPNVANDLFMRTHKRGTPSGRDEDGERIGVISIEQPSFWNAAEIDVNVPLTQQEVKPVRPDMNIERIEEERAADPEGFGQEYLCRPIVDEYRFFSVDSIEAAMERGEKTSYLTGIDAPKSADLRVIGVDIGISHDDTVAQVFDHLGNKRFHRYSEVIDDGVLAAHGFANPDRANAEQVVDRLAFLFREMDADLVVLDRTGPGETFDRQLTDKLGRAVVGFNFSDKRKVEEMMGDMNTALRNGRVSLIPDDRLKDELSSIIKEKKEDWSVPKFSGKDNSESGKDDTAMASVLGAFPPGYAVAPGREADQRTTAEAPPTEASGQPPESTVERPSRPASKSNADAAFGSVAASRRAGGYSSRNSYRSRHSRR